jgi:hypothetical protein
LRDPLSDGTFHCNWFETGYCSSDSWSWFGDNTLEECPEDLDEDPITEQSPDPIPEVAL